jgi:hypothetical protein
MPTKKSVQTGWVIAATEGATVDGRTITKAWINDMADTYSPDEYTAVIWPEHFRSSWGPFEGKNWGTVDEVKASKQDGKLRLFIKLTANDYLLEANKDGQKLFMSIEPNIDFKGTGKCYLQGLAVTDSPASTGTTRLKFSMGDSEVQHDYSQLEALQHSDFIFTHCEPNSADKQSQEDEAKSLLTKLISLFSINPTKQAAETPDNAEDNPMTKEQYEALMGNIDGVTTKVGELETKFSELHTKVEKFSVPATVPGEETAPVEKTDGVTAEQFSQLTNSLTSLTEKFGALDTKFTEMSKESDGQEPDPAGQGETVSLT